MELQDYVDMVNQMLDDDKDRDAGFAEIDRAVGVEYDNPDELRSLPWIGERKFPTTAFSDAAHASTRAFATRKPKLTIYPAFEDPAEHAQVEKLETAMEWELERLNRIGKKPKHWQVVEYAMKYCAVSIQVEYLPYTLKKMPKDNPRIKHILRQSKFNWHVHHPATVHSFESVHGMEAVCKATEVTAQELVNEFGRENPGIANLLAEFDPADIASKMATVYFYFDVTTWDRRMQWACPKSEIGQSMVASVSEFVFRDEDHGMPFIPWVVVDNQDPIMLPAIQAGLYDNANMLNTIAFSKAIDMAAHPELWIRTLDGSLRNVSIDNTNPSQPLVTDKTTEVQQLRPPAIDPQLMAMQNEAKSEIFRSTVAQVLADIDNIGSQATFSTVNAMLEAALTQLALGQNAAERAETLAFYQMFQWIDFSEIPLVAYRKKGDGKEKKPGQELVIQPGYTGENTGIATFDLDFLYLDVRLQSTTITDKQAELNNEVLKVERLGKSRSAALEAIGEENYNADFERRAEEDLAQAEVQSEATRIMQAPQMEMLQAQQQAEAEAEQAKAAAEAQNAQGEQRGQIFSPTEGMDNRAGGGAGAAGAVPGATAMTQTGMAPGGGGLA